MFHLVVLGASGKVLVKRKFSPKQLLGKQLWTKMALKIGCTDDRPQDCKAPLCRGALSLFQSWAEKQFGEVAVRRSSYQIV
jgi:hypothetical protein